MHRILYILPQKPTPKLKMDPFEGETCFKAPFFNSMLVVCTVLYLTLRVVYRLENIHVHDVLFTETHLTNHRLGSFPRRFRRIPSRSFPSGQQKNHDLADFLADFSSLVRYPGGVQKSKPTKSQR